MPWKLLCAQLQFHSFPKHSRVLFEVENCLFSTFHETVGGNFNCSLQLKPVFYQATFFARSDFFFCLVSSRLDLIRNLFNFNNRKSIRAKKVAQWKTGLTVNSNSTASNFFYGGLFYAWKLLRTLVYYTAVHRNPSSLVIHTLHKKCFTKNKTVGYGECACNVN